MIAFDDSSVRVATIAHIGGSVYGVLAWLGVYWRDRRSRPAA
jgi:membrane associated rhomboid family serine protease